jgi:hypothetical protein
MFAPILVFLVCEITQQKNGKKLEQITVLYLTNKCYFLTTENWSNFRKAISVYGGFEPFNDDYVVAFTSKTAEL